MKATIVSYLAALACLLLFDGPWLALMGPRFYTPRLGHLLSASPQWWAVAAFYSIYALGIVVLVVQPARQLGASAVAVFFSGALLGLVAYGTYDLTNQATLRDWPLGVTIVDLMWGSLLTGTASAVSLTRARRAE